MVIKTYKVNCNWGAIIEAESEEEAHRIFWHIFDSSFLKAESVELEKIEKEVFK